MGLSVLYPITVSWTNLPSTACGSISCVILNELITSTCTAMYAETSNSLGPRTTYSGYRSASNHSCPQEKGLKPPGTLLPGASNLRRELPRIPFAPDFAAFATAGKELARLHVDYESLDPWPLTSVENKDVPYSERVTKMKLSADKRSLRINDSLTLDGIPPQTFEYRLGSRSALEWVIDQYQVKGESDPNREDDPGYIVRLVGQIVRVSVETIRIVGSLPAFR